MALNITFTCNKVVDENDNVIDCYYQVYYPEHGVWTKVKQTEDGQYNFNAGDSDGLTQDGELKEGEHVVICFWQDKPGYETGDRSNLKERFAYIVITHDGSKSVYVTDVQLKPKQPPVVSGSLVTEARRNARVRFYNYTEDTYAWYYNGVLHRHTRFYGSELLFDSVMMRTNIAYDPDTNEYIFLDSDVSNEYKEYLNMDIDWRDDHDTVDGYENTASHVFTEIGDYTPIVRAVNKYGLEATREFNIRIKYNPPVLACTFDPNGIDVPVRVGDTVTVKANIVDVDDTIVDLIYRWIIKNRDDGTLISSEDVETEHSGTNAEKCGDTNNGEETINLKYEYSKEIKVLQRHFAEQDVTWCDGYEKNNLVKDFELTITNWLPVTSFELIMLSNKAIRVIPHCTDKDGKIVKYTWKLYLLLPFSSEWSEVWSYTTDKDDSIDITFDAAGHYKMVLISTDDYGDSTAAEKEFDITISDTAACETSRVISNEVFFLFPDHGLF